MLSRTGLASVKNSHASLTRISLAERNSVARASVSAAEPPQHISERVVLVIKASLYSSGSKDGIVNAAIDCGFRIITEKEVVIDESVAKELNKSYEESSNAVEVIKSFTSGPCYALVLEKDSAINSLRSLLGPHSVAVAKESDPTS